VHLERKRSDEVNLFQVSKARILRHIARVEREMQLNDNKPEEWLSFRNVPSRLVLERYYDYNLSSSISGWMSKELISSISEYLAEGFCINQKVDIMDASNIWTLAEIIEIKEDFVRIHYVGYPPKWDEWIEYPSKRIAPLWSHTLTTLANNVVNPAFIGRLISNFEELRHLGIPEEDLRNRYSGWPTRTIVIHFFHSKDTAKPDVIV
jgi:hypothetical protein